MLAAPLAASALADPASAESRLLADLQGNILRPHGRRHARLVAIRFDHAGPARAWLARLPLTSAARQRADEPLVSLLLSSAGYAVLGIEASRQPPDPAFRAGMKRRAAWVDDDTERCAWEAWSRGDDLHAVLLLADDDAPRLERVAAAAQGGLADVATVLGVESGQRLGAPGPDGREVEIEHFGFVDGLSMPQFIDDGSPCPMRRWRPLTPLSVVLVPCPGGGEHAYGSYAVLRKLEQNVQAFALQQRRLADALGLQGEDAAARAGAIIVGRRQDGMPLVPCASDDPNDFDFADDPDGLRCPLASHIRKMNPRGASEIGHTPSRVLESERRHLLARRSISYGTRADDPRADLPPESRPRGGVGLLFLAYQASVVQGFEFVQRMWANWEYSFGAPRDAVDGADLLIAQGGPHIHAQVPGPGGQAVTLPLERCVTLKGGEYLYAPSLSFLRAL